MLTRLTIHSNVLVLDVIGHRVTVRIHHKKEYGFVPVKCIRGKVNIVRGEYFAVP